ncbi:hypothetical protein AVEN_205476-1 [Araneus ventricosus]|uniref:Uncharacterized protein n=1 Tax=Araneus ventricosus TaxID=182803 RepID=A0A4Y2CDC2_ARAVE|nr:hypothetical protein AVEN_205476-1 [Araneus ventricosus]
MKRKSNPHPSVPHIRFHAHELKLTTPISPNGPSLKTAQSGKREERKDERKGEKRKRREREKWAEKPIGASIGGDFSPPLFTAGNRSSRA